MGPAGSADTPKDFLRILSFRLAGTTNWVEWASRPTRLYRLEATNTLTGAGAWTDAGGGAISPSAGSSMTQSVTSVTATTRFYRVKAVIPLSE